MAKDTMTPSERKDMLSLIKKRERVLKSMADERAKSMMSEFEAQVSAIYSFDDDEIWKAAQQAANDAVAQANEKIHARCRELGIPDEFSPKLHFGWFQGSSRTKERIAELRREASARIEAMRSKAFSEIERDSLNIQTALMTSGGVSDSAKEFLTGLKGIEAVMLSISASDVKQAVEARIQTRTVQ